MTDLDQNPVLSLRVVEDERRREEARNVRAALFAECRSILEQLGEDVSGFALVIWDRQGDLRSSYYTGYGPIRSALVPTLAGDALNRHVGLDMEQPTHERWGN